MAQRRWNRKQKIAPYAAERMDDGNPWIGDMHKAINYLWHRMHPCPAYHLDISPDVKATFSEAPDPV